jgi:polysaccharide export outer membrane protein
MVTILFPCTSRRLCKGFLFMMIIFCIGGFSSCLVSKPVRYFEGLTDSTMMENIVIPDQLIQKGDMLSIKIFSDNPDATHIFNQASGGGGSSSPKGGQGNETQATSNATGGYLVDNKGQIRLHAIGEIYVEGLTRQQLEEIIIRKLQRLEVLSNPYCLVRFGNFKITILGEVASPGIYTIPTDKASVLEALGLAGDINVYGRKDQIMLIRENQGKRMYTNLDLTNPSIFQSPYFYMRQNDVLVVQPDKRKQTPADLQTIQLITLSFSVISVLTIIVNSFR